MKSCETKVTLSNVENHLTTSHPDVYILFKRILMEQYGISKRKCELCGFCFQTEADYESHLGTFFKFSFLIGPKLSLVDQSEQRINLKTIKRFKMCPKQTQSDQISTTKIIFE